MEQAGVVRRQRHFRFADLMTETRLSTKLITSVAVLACVSLTLMGCGQATVIDHFPKGEQDQSQDNDVEKPKAEKKP